MKKSIRLVARSHRLGRLKSNGQMKRKEEMIVEGLKSLERASAYKDQYGEVL